MKIAYIVPSLSPKGPVIVVYELVQQMIKNGHECTVFYFDNKESIDFNSPTLKIDINQPIDFSVYDVIHSHGMRPDKYVSRFRENSGKVRYVTTLHNYIFHDLRYQYNWLIAQIYGRIWLRYIEKFDAIVALSKDAQSYYSKLLKNRNVFYAYNTRSLDTTKMLDQQEINSLLSFKESSILIGVNALLTHRKGIDILIKALPLLPNYKLYIVGDGKDSLCLKKLAKRYGVIDRCYFAGLKSNAYRYLEYYDIFALPSRSEGFPLSLLEAAIYGKKCVTSDLKIIKEAFTSEEVQMFHISEPESIVNTIKYAFSNENLCFKIKDKYKKSYAPHVMYNRYIDIYNGKI